MKHKSLICRLGTLTLVVLALCLVAWGFASCYSSSGGGFDTSCKHVRVANCVCQACNQEVHANLTYIEAQDPTCTENGLNANVYLCEECGRGFYDQKCRREVDYDAVVSQPLGHNFVGDICARCNANRNPSGNLGTDDNPNKPDMPDNKIDLPLEAWIEALNIKNYTYKSVEYMISHDGTFSKITSTANIYATDYNYYARYYDHNVIANYGISEERYTLISGVFYQIVPAEDKYTAFELDYDFAQTLEFRFWQGNMNLGSMYYVLVYNEDENCYEFSTYNDLYATTSTYKFFFDKEYKIVKIVAEENISIYQTQIEITDFNSTVVEHPEFTIFTPDNDESEHPGTIKCQHTSLEFREGCEPQCQIDGMVSYYICMDCGRYFYDAEAQNKIIYGLSDFIYIPNLGGHSYDNACDNECNVCFEYRVTKHVYDNDKDATCNGCGKKRNVDCDHVYTDECDNRCNICRDERDAPHFKYSSCDMYCALCRTWLSAEHVFDYPCDSSCSECGIIIAVYEHTYDNYCDDTCNYCGIERTPYHVYDDGYDSTCNSCGYERQHLHDYDDIREDGVYCLICGELEHRHEYFDDCDEYCHCGYKRQILHMYESPCATTCYNCQHTRYIPCSEHTDPQGSGICEECYRWYHYYDKRCDAICNDCGFVREDALHSLDINGICRYCGENLN